MEEPKLENEVRIWEVKRKNVRTSMEKLKSASSDLLLFNLQWDDLDEYLNSTEKYLFKSFSELMSKEKELQSRSLAVEERVKKVEAAEALVSDLEMKANGISDEIEEKRKESKAVEMRLTELRKSVEECTVEERLKTNQLNESLRKIQVEIDLKEKELKKMDSDLEWYHVEVSTKEEHLCRTQTCRSELEEEIDRKKKDLSLVRDQIAECEKLFEIQSSELARIQSEVELERHRTCDRELREQIIEKKGIALTVVLDKTAECRKGQELVKEKLDSQQNLLDERSLELICKEKKLKELRLEIELMEEKVKSLNGEMEETCKQIEPKAKKLEDIERLIEEGNTRYESIKKFIKEHTEEIGSKEKEKNEMLEAIHKLSLQIASEEKTLERAKALTEQASKKHHEKEKNLNSTRRHLEECTAKYHLKKNELRSVNKQVEEGDKRLKRLDNCNKELGRKIQVKQVELCSIKKTIKECSGELKVERNYLDRVQRSLTNLTAELKSKEGKLDAVKKTIQDSLKEFQSKEEQRVRLEASFIKREEEFGLKEKELNTKDQQLKFEEQKLAKCVKDYEQKLKKLSSFCQQGNTDQQVVLVQEINSCDEKHLQLHLKKCSEIQLDILSDLKSSSDPAKLVLETIQMMEQTNLDPLRKSSIYLLECLINMSPKANSEVLEQAIKLATEWKDTTLVKAVDAVDVLSFLYSLAAFSSAYAFDAENVQSLFDVTFLRKYIPSLCEALGVLVNNVIPPEQQLPVQENVASSSHEDALMDLDGSASFSPNEVLTGLQYMKDPGSYVLNLVSDALMDARQRGELGLAEPIVKTLIPLFEELPRVVRPSEHLNAEARKVAQQWSLMMGNTGQMSPLETWGFLQFIVAYGLVDSIKQNETIQFASNIAHFRQAPKLFQSLGLSFAIPNFVKQLRNERKVIEAIRFMFYFNLNPPLELLKEEIINLRQVKESDAGGKLRDIIELIEDFNLEIDLPVDLILKFMVPKEAQNQNQCDVLSSTVIPTVYGVPLSQASESTVVQAQSSHQSRHKRPRVLEPRVTSSAIRPRFNPSSSSHGR